MLLACEKRGYSIYKANTMVQVLLNIRVGIKKAKVKSQKELDGKITILKKLFFDLKKGTLLKYFTYSLH